MEKVWDNPAITAEMKRRGMTYDRLATECNVPKSILSMAMSASHGHRVGEQIISRFLGVPAEELWAERFRKRNMPVEEKHRSKYGVDYSSIPVLNQDKP
jgi:lambda repressor-like predicted transcriptional regulator